MPRVTEPNARPETTSTSQKPTSSPFMVNTAPPSRATPRKPTPPEPPPAAILHLPDTNFPPEANANTGFPRPRATSHTPFMPANGEPTLSSSFSPPFTTPLLLCFPLPSFTSIRVDSLRTATHYIGLPRSISLSCRYLLLTVSPLFFILRNTHQNSDISKPK